MKLFKARDYRKRLRKKLRELNMRRKLRYHADGGVTAHAIADIVNRNTFFWNGVITRR